MEGKVKAKLLIIGSIAFINLERPLALKGAKGRKFVEKLRRTLIVKDVKYSLIRDYIFTRELPQKKGTLIEIEIPWIDKPNKGFTMEQLIAKK